MTILNKLLIAGALIIGLQPLAYGYNSTVLNNQITTIEIAKNALKQYDCDPKTVEATRYLKNVIKNEYSTSDETIIQLATILNEATYSYETLDKITNSILAIKAQEELKKQEKEEIRNSSERRDVIIVTAMLTFSAVLVAHGIYRDISNFITYKKYDFIDQMVKRINHNNSSVIPNLQTNWLNYSV